MKAVQFRHVDVQEQQVEAVPLQGVQGLAAVAGDPEVVPLAAQEVLDEQLVERVVLGD